MLQHDGRAVSGTVLIAEDDPGVRTLLCEVLTASGFDVVVAESGPAAVDEARAARPVAAVLDVNLPGLSGYEVCHELRRVYGPGLPILFLSGDRTEAYDRVAGFLIGGDDYVVKPFAPEELVVRLRALIRRAAPVAGARSDLTHRELQVLRLLADGLEQAEIARQLVISPKTVGTHIERILSKLGVRSRAQAVAVAYRDELVGTLA